MFHTYVVNVLSRYCIFFAIVFHVFSGVFASVSYTCFKCLIYLQTYVAKFHLYVSKVYQLLHML
jgi:hypothetical protein